ncbi:hypothetical protein LCGC14_2641670, partial [marine sediment metagenome]
LYPDGKTCSICGEKKEIIEFHWYDKYPYAECKACTRLRDRSKSRYKYHNGCELCGVLSAPRFESHHIDYVKDISVVLCARCHTLVHGFEKICLSPREWAANKTTLWAQRRSESK